MSALTLSPFLWPAHGAPGKRKRLSPPKGERKVRVLLLILKGVAKVCDGLGFLALTATVAAAALAGLLVRRGV